MNINRLLNISTMSLALREYGVLFLSILQNNVENKRLVICVFFNVKDKNTTSICEFSKDNIGLKPVVAGL